MQSACAILSSVACPARLFFLTLKVTLGRALRNHAVWQPVVLVHMKTEYLRGAIETISLVNKRLSLANK
jgi:hypothetical protein